MEDNEFLEKLGQRIAKLRKAKGWTQEEFAEITGMNRSALARLESGKVNTTVKVLRYISQSLGVKIEKLVKVD